MAGSLQDQDAQPNAFAYPVGHALPVTNLAIRSTIWGRPDRLTISLMKNDVLDRRINPIHAPTLAEITEGAFSPNNAQFHNPNEGHTNRPFSLGYPVPSGGWVDPFRQPVRYCFPCPKPVGQIILGMSDFSGADASPLEQSCANAVVNLTLHKDGRTARIELGLGMTSNVYALRAQLTGTTRPVTLRLYRNRDTTHQAYMNEAGTAYTISAAAVGRAWNGPMDPPHSGKSGDKFWIVQHFPGDRTFPHGEFYYVMMGKIVHGTGMSMETVEGQRNLGTPPPDKLIASAPGAAATATFIPDSHGKIEALVVVVSSIDAVDPMTEAAARLDLIATRGGFSEVSSQNRTWFEHFYDQRETGRVFTDDPSHPWPGESIQDIFNSWFCGHGGGTKPDMSRLQASALYANPETDSMRWNGLPCYNEVFYTFRYVHNWPDSVDMWKKIVLHWVPGAEENARDTYGMPGMYLVHGYQPPITPNRYVHTTAALELCLGTAAQLLHPLWDEWDYGGSPASLQDCYRPLKETAEFFSAYVKKSPDGLYHVAPCVVEECWGIYPKFARNRDSTSATTMIQWELNRAADAALLLGVDSNERRRWRWIAAHLPPPWTYSTSSGPLLASLQGVLPQKLPDEHPWNAALYPVLLSDAINLDSSAADRQMAARSALQWKNSGSFEARTLVGDAHVGAYDGEKPRGTNNVPGGTAESLLNSRDGIIHFFPAVTPQAMVAFRQFQARGGFLVSAARTASGVYYASITSRLSLPCRFVNPWSTSSVTVKDVISGQRASVAPLNHPVGGFEFASEAGHTYLLSPQ